MYFNLFQVPYYLSFIFIVAFVFLNMMIGIVVETLHQEHEADAREQGEDSGEQLRQMHVQTGRIEARLERLETLLERVVRGNQGKHS